MCISNAVRNILLAERLNVYVTYLLLSSITLLGEPNTSTEMGGKCFYSFLLVSDLSLLCCCVARMLLRELAYLNDSLNCPIMW